MSTVELTTEVHCSGRIGRVQPSAQAKIQTGVGRGGLGEAPPRALVSSTQLPVHLSTSPPDAVSPVAVNAPHVEYTRSLRFKTRLTRVPSVPSTRARQPLPPVTATGTPPSQTQPPCQTPGAEPGGLDDTPDERSLDGVVCCLNLSSYSTLFYSSLGCPPRRPRRRLSRVSTVRPTAQSRAEAHGAASASGRIPALVLGCPGALGPGTPGSSSCRSSESLHTFPMAHTLVPSN